MSIESILFIREGKKWKEKNGTTIYSMSFRLIRMVILKHSIKKYIISLKIIKNKPRVQCKDDGEKCQLLK